VARKAGPRPQPESGQKPHAQSPIELLLQEELARARAEGGIEEFAYKRTYRRVALSALRSSLERQGVEVGTLAVIVRAIELHAFTLSLIFHDAMAMMFAGEGIVDLKMLLQWCHSFFAQTAMIAPSMPAPPNVGIERLMQQLGANTAQARQLMEHIDQSSRYLEDEEGVSEGAEAGDAAEDAVTVTSDTLSQLADALMSVARSWLPPPVFKKFIGAYGEGLLELRDLRHLMLNVEEKPDATK